MTAPVDRGSEAERALEFQLKAVGIPFEREVQFAKPRKWRADFVVKVGRHQGELLAGTGDQLWCAACGDPFPCRDAESPLLIEIDGGTWTHGRHVTGSGHASDSAKRNAAVLLGYRPLTFSPAEVSDGSALKTIEQALGSAPSPTGGPE